MTGRRNKGEGRGRKGKEGEGRERREVVLGFIILSRSAVFNQFQAREGT